MLSEIESIENIPDFIEGVKTRLVSFCEDHLFIACKEAHMGGLNVFL